MYDSRCRRKTLDLNWLGPELEPMYEGLLPTFAGIFTQLLEYLAARNLHWLLLLAIQTQ